MKTIVKLFFLSIIINLASCKGSGKAESEEHADGGHSEISEIIEISDVQMKAVGIELGVVELKNLHSVVRTNGQIVLPPQNKADVNTLTSGIIREISVTEGEFVRKGQTLAFLENLDIVKLQEEYLTLKQELTYSSQEFERQKELNSQNAGTGKVFQQTQARNEANKAKLQGLETQLRQLHIDREAVAVGKLVTAIPITAPIGGIVGKIFVKTGSYADMQTVLMEIADHSQMHCDLQVFEQDFAKIKSGNPVEIVLTNQSNQTISGKVFRINQSFENDSKSIIVHVKIDRPVGANRNSPPSPDMSNSPILPGMYVSALIDVGGQMLKAVPSSAIANAEGKQYLFLLVDTEDETFQFKKIEVITGTSELGYVEIKPLEAIPEDATIITKGAFYVMSMASGGEEEE
ncbi:hemolysin D [Bacteroidia bacterium]|nr:hemolysin D [Bacteroidia bacterium]